MNSSVRLWTAAGIERLKNEIAALESQVKIKGDELKDTHRYGGCADRDSDLLESGVSTQDYQRDRNLLEAKRQELASVRPAPISAEKVSIRIGHLVTVKHITACNRHKKGDQVTFILGGQGENDDSGEVHTRSSASYFGQAIAGKRVRAIVDVHVPQGKSYEIKIVGIELTTADKAELEQRQQKENRQTA